MPRPLFALLLSCVFLLGACASNSGIRLESAVVGPQGAEEGPFRQQRWLIPLQDQHLLMTATLWRPKGPGPFPLAVINHASTQDPSDRLEDPTPRYEEVAQWLVQRGYAALLPVRPGHGMTGGPYLEDQGGCENADYVESGLVGANITEAVLGYMGTQKFVKKNRTIVIGQSAGGWSALALASRNSPTVRAVVNFAGGRGGRSLGQPNTNCAADRLIDAAERLGRTARTKTLWIYTENDSYFGPDLSKRMVDAFRRGGGSAEYHLLPSFSDDGHFLLLNPSATPVWAPIVDKFLARHR
jgi:dienelactone hydrolase